MQYGFLIDHRRCIGCHACTVACKAENDVPVGNFRTWVKYVERGRFPEIRRHFAVLRCNHCTNAPCVTICPVNALEKRKDGIVDLDRDVCIGCRACMQACPYDAIYLNEDNGCVEKCHYCAHRVEKGLEPACVIVCPEQAIVCGDLHDPSSKIAKLVANETTLVRRAEQRTGPNVHYLGAEPIALHPGAAERPATYLWSERPAHKPEPWPSTLPTVKNARVTLDAGHRVEWGGAVALYLLTKGIAAGVAMLAPFADRLGLAGFARDFLPELLALVFTGVTTFLLVEDLARPRLFLTLITRGNPKSWLVRGAWILLTFTATLGAALACRWLARTSGLPHGFNLLDYDAIADKLRWANAALGVATAGYTAFLFAQCEGRDLWQSKLLLPHLLVQAVACGAVTMLPAAPRSHALLSTLLVTIALHLLFAFAERWKRHETDNARQAAAFLDVVRWQGLPAFRLSSLLLIALPLALWLTWFGEAVPALRALLFVAPLLVLFCLFLYEAAYVRAAQLPPLS